MIRFCSAWLGAVDAPENVAPTSKREARVSLSQVPGGQGTGRVREEAQSKKGFSRGKTSTD